MRKDGVGMLVYETYADAKRMKDSISDVLLGVDDVNSVSTAEVPRGNGVRFYVKIGLKSGLPNPELLASINARLQNAQLLSESIDAETFFHQEQIRAFIEPQKEPMIDES